MNLIERFWNKVEVLDEGCWQWKGGKTLHGYAQLWAGKPEQKLLLAHRFSYTYFRSPITTGLEVDHLCRNRACVNPWHMELVSHAVNLARGNRSKHIGLFHSLQTHCLNGHEFNHHNTYYHPIKGYRKCRICSAAHQRDLRQRRRLAKADLAAYIGKTIR